MKSYRLDGQSALDKLIASVVYRLFGVLAGRGLLIGVTVLFESKVTRREEEEKDVPRASAFPLRIAVWYSTTLRERV